jgi:hypothetical protein
MIIGYLHLRVQESGDHRTFLGLDSLEWSCGGMTRDSAGEGYWIAPNIYERAGGEHEQIWGEIVDCLALQFGRERCRYPFQ